MKIVVTGGNGMVGNCIKDIIKDFKEHNFTFLNRSLNNDFSLDLTNRELVLDFFSKNEFDYIIHLAADVGGLYKNIKNNSLMFSNNIRINENILEASVNNGIKRGIFILSSCIFPPNNTTVPFDEDYIHAGPPHKSNEGYAYSKRMLHIQCQNINKDFNTEFICLCPVNLYGPYDNFNIHDSHLIPGLIHRFINTKNKNYVAYGTGRPIRQFLYAEDFAYLICDILINKTDIKTSTLICCNNEEYDIKYVVNLISEILEIRNNDIKWDTKKSDGCYKKTVSNNKLIDLYPDFKFTSLKKGLSKTIKWYNNNLKIIRN